MVPIGSDDWKQGIRDQDFLGLGGDVSGGIGIGPGDDRAALGGNREDTFIGGALYGTVHIIRSGGDAQVCEVHQALGLEGGQILHIGHRCLGIRGRTHGILYTVYPDTADAIIPSESSPYNDLAVRLDLRGQNRAICPRTGIEGSIQAPVRVQTGDPVSRCSVVGSEISPYDDLAVRLDLGGQNSVACPRTRIEPGIQAPVRVQTGDQVYRCSVVGSELSPDNDLAVRLNLGGKNLAVCPRTGIEPGIQAPVRVQTGDIVSRCSVVGSESPPNYDLAIRLCS